MKMTVSDAAKAARGQWARILPALGVKVMKNRHTSCPVCGGTDRFRFDDQEGLGTWIFNQCGAGDGMDLVKKALSLSLTEAAARVNGLTGSLPQADNTPAASAGEDNEAARAAAVKQAQQLVSNAQQATGTGLTVHNLTGDEVWIACRPLTSFLWLALPVKSTPRCRC